MRSALSLPIVLLAASITLAQTATSAGIHPVSGRRYANVMGWEGAEWLERSEREQEEEPDRALDALGTLSGLSVADVGSGSGYFTVRLASRVGSKGRVYANDLQPEMLKMLAARLSRERVSNVTLVQGGIDNPRLPADAIDLILMVDVYHEFSEPQKMLRAMRAALKVDGRLVLLGTAKRSRCSYPIRAQDERCRGQARARSRRVHAVAGGRTAAPPAHSDLHQKSGSGVIFTKFVKSHPTPIFRFYQYAISRPAETAVVQAASERAP